MKQHEKNKTQKDCCSASRKRYNMKKMQCEKRCSMKRVEDEKSVTGTEKVQPEKCATRTKCNMKRV